MDLSVIILNWNARPFLVECLRSLRHGQEGVEFETIVVDNVSEDDSAEVVRRDFPEVKLLVTAQNIGFGAGNNTAIAHCTGRYILFLNPDTVVWESALPKLVQFADAGPDAGIVGARLLNADGSLQYSCRHYPNLGTGFFRNTPLGRLFPKNRFTNDYLMQDWDHNSPRDVDWVSGAALMIRRTLLDQIGAFDEEFFMYCEDVDLCRRANFAENPGTGKPWRVVYCPDAVITHYIGKSSDYVPTRMTYEFHRSQYLFYKKHYRATTPLLMRALIPLGITLRATGQMAKYRYRQISTRLRRVLRGEPAQNVSPKLRGK